MKLASEGYSMMSETSKLFFLQSNVQYSLPKSGKNEAKLHRIIVYGNPTLFPILGTPRLELFLDGTFRLVPKGFTQRFRPCCITSWEK
jgi:hypothetical protein